MLNGIMFQYFEWYLPDDGRLWQKLAGDAEALAEKGVTAVWIPPCYKATGSNDTGYGCYDLYDLGEFEQKGSIRTKYGTKAELIAAIDALHQYGIQVYADVVLNHKAGADRAEVFKAVEVNPDNRLETIGEAHDIEGWTGFDFPGRGSRYSAFKWNFNHFTGVDYDQRSGKKGIFRIIGENKDWAKDVSREHGNFDYLMFADIDHDHPDVHRELISWCRWFARELKLDGFRLDAVKHISADFMTDLAETMLADRDNRFYLVAEYWQGDDSKNINYIEQTAYTLDLFDVPLHYQFAAAGQAGASYDLRRIFDHTLVQERPEQAVTFVENHDSQPGQALESPVADWFKPHAYALILLRRDGYPCVFYGDYYGSAGEHPLPSRQKLIDQLLLLRSRYAHGEQDDYFENFEVIGWVRRNEQDGHPPLVVNLTAQTAGQSLRMFVGQEMAGKIYADFLGHLDAKVTIDSEGWGDFPVAAGSVSCWLQDGLPLNDLPIEG